MNDWFNSNAGQEVPAREQRMRLPLTAALNLTHTRRVRHFGPQEVSGDAQIHDRMLSLMARIGHSDHPRHAGNPFPRGLPVPQG
ncbi:MAG: hypothetical protein ABI389_05090 [Rhodanobacter sp.]